MDSLSPGLTQWQPGAPVWTGVAPGPEVYEIYPPSVCYIPFNAQAEVAALRALLHTLTLRIADLEARA